MKVEFGVAICYHCCGASPKHLTEERFTDYDSANAFAEKFREECEPTIYCIINDKYIYYCSRSAVENSIYQIYNIQNMGWGQIETRIWWREFEKNPKKFFQFAVGIL